MTTYKFTVTVKTKTPPGDIIDFVQRKAKDVLPILSMNYEVVSDRPTDVEHHGGLTDEEG
tara:strand:- start:254 stop:433 length:180 start_codon:yes stop_codon:yes gene_type:complete